MLHYLLYFLISTIIFTFIYIKIKFRFWSSQPVFHIYNLWYWIFPPGIIQHDKPSPTKYYDYAVETLQFNKTSTKKKALMCNLIQCHYLYNKNAKYHPKFSDIIEYFNGNHPSAIISFYKLNLPTRNIACITGRNLYGTIKNNPIEVQYVDFLCVNKKYRKKGIAPKLIYSHYLNSRKINSPSIFMFKREGKSHSIVPIASYKTYAFSDVKWRYVNKNLPRNILCQIITPQNSELLLHYLSEVNEAFKFFITPKKENIYNLIKYSLIIPFIILDNNIFVGAIFYRYPKTSYYNNESIECIASYCKNGYENVFKESFVNTIVLLKKRYKFSIILIENISHNYLLLEKVFSRSLLKWECFMAYYFYNFAYRSFKSNDAFILC